MGNNITGYVGYGVALFEDEATSAQKEFLALGTDWESNLLKMLYPEGKPVELDIKHHYLEGHDRHHRFVGDYSLPFIMIQDGHTSYGITGSADSPGDLSDFIAKLVEQKTTWNALLVNGVRSHFSTTHPFQPQPSMSIF